jgi:hypothetical protein
MARRNDWESEAAGAAVMVIVVGAVIAALVAARSLGVIIMGLAAFQGWIVDRVLALLPGDSSSEPVRVAVAVGTFALIGAALFVLVMIMMNVVTFIAVVAVCVMLGLVVVVAGALANRSGSSDAPLDYRWWE